MKPTIASVLLALSLVAAAGCSSSKTTPEQASDFVDKYCDYVESCCNAIGRPTNGVGCRSTLKGKIATSTYHSDRADACLAAIDAQSAKEPSWCSDQPASDRATCDGALEGPNDDDSDAGDSASIIDTMCSSNASGPTTSP